MGDETRRDEYGRVSDALRGHKFPEPDGEGVAFCRCGAVAMSDADVADHLALVALSALPAPRYSSE